MDIDGLPRCLPRQKSDDKAKLEVDDIFGLIDYMDEHNALSKFPLFVAKNLERLLPFKTDVLDLCLAVKRINALAEKVEAASMQIPDPSTASDVKSDKRVAALEEKLDLIVKHLGISGAKGNSTPENTGSRTVMGSLVSFATGPVSSIDASGPSRTDVQLVAAVQSNYWCQQCRFRLGMGKVIAGSQLDVKQGNSPTTVPRPTRQVLHGSRRDDDSSG